jgi:hypothetical protein
MIGGVILEISWSGLGKMGVLPMQTISATAGYVIMGN